MHPCAYEYSLFARKVLGRITFWKYPLFSLLVPFPNLFLFKQPFPRRVFFRTHESERHEFHWQRQSGISQYCLFEDYLPFFTHSLYLLEELTILLQGPWVRKGKEHFLFRFELMSESKF